MSRKLIVTGGRRDRELQLVGRIVVGRDPMCDLSESDTLLSRRHAEFTLVGDDIVVRDLGSRNGIYVNGSRIAEGTLQSGDVVRIGNLHLQYVEDSAPLVAVPELADDATGIVLPGQRNAAGIVPPVLESMTAITPPPVPPATPPAAETAREPADDATAYVPASGIRRPQSPASGVKLTASAARPPAAAKPAPAADDAAQATRVVPPPGRTNVQPPPSVIRTAVQTPPIPTGPPTAVQPPPRSGDADEPTSIVTARPRTTVQPPPLPPRDDDDATAFLPRSRSAVQPKPLAPPREDAGEPTMSMPPPRTAVQAKPGGAETSAIATQARALARTMEAIASFLGSPAVEQTAQALTAPERTAAQASTPPADLVGALRELAARVGAAANELR